MYNTDVDHNGSELVDNLYCSYNKTEELNGPNLVSSLESDERLYRELLQPSIQDLFSYQSREDEFAEQISSFESIDDPWESMYLKFESFVKKNGHTNISVDREHHPLKDWINRQILNKRFLSGVRFKKLDSLGIDWNTFLSRDHGWELMFSRLEAFRDRFGHCRVPYFWYEDKQLALWTLRQRKMYLQSRISESRKRLLNDIGFTWQVKELYNMQWENYFQQLLAFQTEHGHFNVPGKEKKIVSWIERQRLLKKKKKMPSERENRLNQINFIWDFKKIKKKDWDEKYRQLAEFNNINDHSFVPLNYKENKPLGTWVALQRKSEVNGTLSASRLKKLNRLNFVWSRETQNRLKSDYDTQWESSFEKLKTYKKLRGTCQVSLKSDPKLQSWTAWQRKMFVMGKVSPERIARLNEISFHWCVNEGYWLKMFDILTSFYKKFGHTSVPSQWVEDPKLAGWTYRVRVEKHELSTHKIELLNSLGFKWTIKKKVVVGWSQMYGRLLAFKEGYGHTRVPVKWQKDPKLGKWVSRMRYERNKINLERIILLESIGFDWEKSFREMKLKS
jgi:hypothetical protein